jgi:hypothetical protein
VSEASAEEPGHPGGPTREDAWAFLAEDPGDWRARRLLAAMSRRDGEGSRAACLWWQVYYRKRPLKSPWGSAAWFDRDAGGPDVGDDESRLPAALHARLRGGHDLLGLHRLYPCVRAAEEALHAAWAEAREDGWEPRGEGADAC